MTRFLLALLLGVTLCGCKPKSLDRAVAGKSSFCGECRER